MRFAYFGVPHLGGTFSVYRQLRAGLAPSGIELVWLGVGAEAAAAFDAPQWAADRPYGVVVRTSSGNAAEIARAIIRTIEAERFDGVVFNVLSDRLQTNLARYLPRQLLRLMIVHNCTFGTYAAAGAIRDHVHTTVAVAPRIRDDLVAAYGFDGARVAVIANSTDIPPVRAGSRGTSPPRLLFLGRIEDQAKGVLLLPRLMRRLPAEALLTIAGDGPDLEALRRACAPLGERVVFRGPVPPDAIGNLLAEHDILLMPSRFEGCPVVLLEAMASGCVPVASYIRGVTDAIVSHGVDGRLFSVGNVTAAAEQILDLIEHPQALEHHAAQARDTVRRRFERSAMASAYRGVLDRLSAAPPPIAPPLDLDDWSLPSGLRTGLRTRLPRPVKNALRTLKERLATGYRLHPSFCEK